MAITAYDTFTDTDGILLENHISDSGHGWTKNYGGDGAEIRNNAVNYLDGTYSNVYTIQKTPESADYAIEVDIFQGANTAGGACLRFDSANGYYYTFLWNSSGAYQIYKNDANGWTKIGSDFLVSQDDAWHTCKLEITGSTINFYYDGVLQITVDDTSITAAGEAGLYFYAGEGQAKDNFNLIESTASNTITATANALNIAANSVLIQGAAQGLFKILTILTSLGVNAQFRLKNQITLGDFLNLINSLTIEAELKLINEIKDFTKGNLKLQNALIDAVLSSLKIVNSVEVLDPQKFTLANEIRGEISKVLKILSNIDDYTFTGLIKIITGLTDPFQERLIIANSIDQTIKTLTSKPTIIGLRDITGRVKSLEINIYGDETISSFTAEAAQEVIKDIGKNITVNFESESWRFFVEETEEREKEKTVELWGRTIEIEGLYYPYAQKSKYSFIKQKASQIISTILGDRAVYQAPDFTTTLEGEYYPLEAVKEVMAQIGGTVRIGQDGKVYCLYIYDKEYISADIFLDRSEILTLSKQRIKGEIDAVRVKLAESVGNINIEAEKTEAAPGEWVKVKVWADAAYKFKVSPGASYKRKGTITEEITETVIIDDKGEGQLKYPPVSISTPGVEFDGQKIKTAQDCAELEITYLTRYDLYEISRADEGAAVVCFVETDDQIFVNAGTGQAVKEVQANLYDLEAAKYRALAELAENGDREILNINCLFLAPLISPAVYISTRHGGGALKRLSFQYDNGAKLNLEVLKWRQISL